jgi:hypothetical protein
MRHVDEGTIHAWLDRQVTDPAEAAWIEAHLAECGPCRARLEDERATLEQADALLAAVAPAADAGRVAFEALVARADASSGKVSSHSALRSSRTWMIPAGWAASVVLAAALGWAARDLSPREQEAPRETPPVSGGGTQSDASPAELTPAAPAQAKTTSPASPEVAGPSRESVAAPREFRASPESLARGEPASRAADAAPKAVEVQNAQEAAFTLSGALGEREQPAAALPPPEPALPLNPVAVPPPLTLPEAAATPTVAARTLEENRLEALTLAPPPAAARPAGGGGGGRGGGGGSAGGDAGGAAGRAAGGRGGRGAAAAASPPAGTVAVDGLALADAKPATESSAAIGWRTLSRTEAAAVSGMPLYGIEGLTPMLTMLSADNAAVRTLYNLASGETLEIVQRRVALQQQADTRGERVGESVTVVADAPAVDVQSARQQAAAGAPRPPPPSAAPPPPAAGSPAWSTVRGDWQLTVRGTTNPSAFGGRLRLD